MNSRMNRLRRSISRSVHQLGNLSRQGSLSGLVQLPTSSTPATLSDRFASPSNFGQLDDTIKKNNESLKEIVSILEEKANLDFHYSKALKKLSARLHKITHGAKSEIDHGWTTVAEQFDVHATIHNNLGSAMTDDVIQPLRSVQQGHQRTIRAAEMFVEKETHKLKNKKEDTNRIKKNLYEAARQLEKVEYAAEQDSITSNKIPTRRQKLHDQVVNLEDVYISDTIDMEKQRRVTENVLRKGVESLELVERQRLVHCQAALGRYQKKIEQLAPNLQQMFERFSNNLDLAVSAQASDYIEMLQPTTVAVNQVVLADLYVSLHV
ncbi:unnamed protein product [Auanema sp. JU1783]|nr:unnamed protein product [Auanema sp. JU1783]